MYLAKTPNLLKPLASDLVWDIKTEEKELFLTFDDGPDPDVTPQVLDILESYDAKATFFCVGRNVEKHPALFNLIMDSGHSVGNHTFDHEKGWETSVYPYLRSTLRCSQWVNSSLFRPPYGKISLQQTNALKKRYKLIMWDVVSADFDASISPERCLSNVIDNAKAGSIVVFHDSQKCREKVLYALPRVLEHFAGRGYRFSKITPERIP